MGHHNAREILEALVQGVHPETRVALRGEAVLEDTTVLRALLEAATALRASEVRALRRAQLPSNVGRLWTTEEEAALRRAFERKTPPEEIARTHRRTVRAIAQRLQRLGLLREDSPQWGAYAPFMAREEALFEPTRHEARVG